MYVSSMVNTVTLGKKGQITLPKKIRDEDDLKEGDELRLMHLPGGSIFLEKRVKPKSPEDTLLEVIRRFPRIDAESAWKEVKQERARERS